MADNINPDHYKRLPAEAIEIIESAIDDAPSNQDAYLHGQVLKYILRCWNKNGIEDLKKAKWYLDRLVNSLDEYEQQKAADQQLLKDHPFGKLKTAALNSDKIPEGYRKLNDSSEEPRQLGDLRWSVAERRYVEISVDEIGYANRDNWAACRKVTEEADVEWVDAVWPQDFGKPARFWPNPICQNEGIPDDSLWDLGTVAGYVADGYRKWIIEMDGKISCHMYCQVKKKVGTKKQPPDGWRFLEVGEVICKGDVCLEKGQIHSLGLLMIGQTCQTHWMPIIRRNRFEVGEKVVYVNDNPSIVYTVDLIRADGAIIAYNKGVGHAFSPDKLAPYIEETKPTVEVAVEVTGEVKHPIGCPDGWRFLEVGEVICKGDVCLEKGQIHSLGLLMIGQTYQTHWMPIIRRNRFEVGEKVVKVFSECVYEITAILDRGVYEMQTPSGYKIRLCAIDLAPYIEDAT